ncbi:hypothetical protein AXG93_1459s1010 [Marchantia polymorpha subsp. ruderalis]|uniref:Citrate synthase n=1 Tax=Marchantia polymorpha subsp. ruderalis TaxID=1480154 RepID=A0A176WB53_MARPO|nr:hypothetical protein AXG93_1459s1010 [Marchantia polymorpha subsp. ruderalis]
MVRMMRMLVDQGRRTSQNLQWVRHLTNNTDLKSRLEQLIPEEQARLKDLKTKYGKNSLGEATVDMAIGGMRGIKGMLWETSLLDADEGIRFRNMTIPECQAKLPASKPKGEPLPEGLFWLLVTGEVPTKEQVSALTQEFQDRSQIPRHVFDVLDALPKTAHPMTQFTAGILALQTESEFARAYAKGIDKRKYWEPTYEDSMNLIARLPEIAAYVYRRTYKDGETIAANPNLDYAANFAHMLGYEDPKFHELMRLYLSIHSDHEGGNVSAHTVHLVGSALSDPYLSVAAGMNGLAGPLHGLANQEVLRWIEDIVREIGTDVPTEQLKEFIWKTLKSGKVVPGYGHAVLRKTDPRFWPKVIAFERYSCVRGSDTINMWRFLKYDDNSSTWQVILLLYNCSIELKKLTTTVTIVPVGDFYEDVHMEEMEVKLRNCATLNESSYLHMFQHGEGLYIARGMADRDSKVDIWRVNSERTFVASVVASSSTSGNTSECTKSSSGSTGGAVGEGTSSSPSGATGEGTRKGTRRCTGGASSGDTRNNTSSPSLTAWM